MKLAVIVYGAPSSPASANALRYCRAALSRGHELVRVFFYGEGVYNANCLAVPPQDEPNRVRDWQQLSQEFELDAVVCIAAALKRGVLDETEAKRHEKDASNLAPGFELSGLGQLIDACQQADRTLTFG